MFVENLPTLRIHKLTREQYEREEAAGRLEENAIYLTPDEGVDLSGYVTIDQLENKSDKDHNHDDKYDAKNSANGALIAAKNYTDTKTSGLASTTNVSASISSHNTSTTAHNDIRTTLTAVKEDVDAFFKDADLTASAKDTLKEIQEYITSDATAAAEMTASLNNKSEKGHSHVITDVSDLQAALDGKAPTSHGTHVTYSSTAPVMDGTASVGSASAVARSDHRHPTDTSRASKTEFDNHTSDTTAHMTSTQKTQLTTAYNHSQTTHAPSNAQANQNAFSNVKVGSTTIAADTATDTIEFVGSNVTITPDVNNDKVTFTVADGSTSAKGVVQLTNSTSSASTTTAATPSSVKSAYDLANTAKTNAATAQTKADSAYTLAESKVDSLSDLGITATATELNYVDGVTSNVQTQLNGKVPTSRTVNGKALSSNITLSASDVSAYSKTEIDSMNFITIEDIDTICGGAIQYASSSEGAF